MWTIVLATLLFGAVAFFTEWEPYPAANFWNVFYYSPPYYPNTLRVVHFICGAITGLAVGLGIAALIGGYNSTVPERDSLREIERRTLVSLDGKSPVRGKDFFALGGPANDDSLHNNMVLDKQNFFYYYYWEDTPGHFDVGRINFDNSVTIHEDERSGGEMIIYEREWTPGKTQWHMGRFTIYFAGLPVFTPDGEARGSQDCAVEIHIPRGGIKKISSTFEEIGGAIK